MWWKCGCETRVSLQCSSVSDKWLGFSCRCNVLWWKDRVQAEYQCELVGFDRWLAQKAFLRATVTQILETAVCFESSLNASTLPMEEVCQYANAVMSVRASSPQGSLLSIFSLFCSVFFFFLLPTSHWLPYMQRLQWHKQLGNDITGCNIQCLAN